MSENDPLLIEAKAELLEAVTQALWSLRQEKKERLARAIEDVIDVKITMMFEKFTDTVLGKQE